MFAPIRPNPIIPSCIAGAPFVGLGGGLASGSRPGSSGCGELAALLVDRLQQLLPGLVERLSALALKACAQLRDIDARGLELVEDLLGVAPVGGQRVA